MSGGLLGGLLQLVFGSGRNVVRETAEVFRVNAEGEARRGAELRAAALAQLAAEFARPERGLFDRLVDAANRLPRPLMALGVLGLFASAMSSPLWFAERMQGIALVPEPLWWLLGAVVSFYFGARHQQKGQEVQRELAAAMARLPAMVDNLAALERLREGPDVGAGVGGEDPMVEPGLLLDDGEPNAALDEWRRSLGSRG